MAESNDLDDFFAKKDKSKKKNRSKFTANDLLAEQGKDPKKEKKKKSKDKEKPQSAGNDTTQQKEDEEWVEISTEKDYSGLRIQSLQSKQDEEVSETPEEPELNEDGEVIEKKDTNEGPWKKVEVSQQPQQISSREKDVTEVIEEASKLVISDGKYVPPHQRGGAAAIVTPVRQAPRRKKVAPNIQSDLDFPSLAGAMEQSKTPIDSGQQFERVRSGGRQTDENHGRSSQLELGNKYDALKN